MSFHKFIDTLPQRIRSCTVLQSVRNVPLPFFFFFLKHRFYYAANTRAIWSPIFHFCARNLDDKKVEFYSTKLQWEKRVVGSEHAQNRDENS
jgi:hypothetical protein